MAHAALVHWEAVPEEDNCQDEEAQGGADRREHCHRCVWRQSSLGRRPRTYCAVATIGTIVLLLTGVASTRGNDLIDAPASDDLSLRRLQKLAIPGHTALDAGRRQDEETAVALGEVATLAKAHEAEDSSEAEQEEDVQLEKEIENGSKGSKVLHQIDDLLDRSSLADVHNTGQVLTAHDMDDIVSYELSMNKTVTLEEHTGKTPEGDVFVQGDMLVPSESDLVDVPELRELREVLLDPRRLARTKYAGKTWKDGRVRWCFNDACLKRPEAMSAFKSALHHVTQQVPCLSFERYSAKNDEKCDVEGSSIMVLCPDSTTCASHVGDVQFPKRSQVLYMGVGCETLGVAAHEIGHSLGMTHEQSRADRRRYVVTFYDNIPDDKEYNFRIRNDAYVDTPYDILSLMHYHAYAFSSNGAVTLEPLDRHMARWLGQREGFSELDIEQIGEMYGCKDTVKPLVHNKQLSLELSDEILKVEHAPFTYLGCLCKHDWQAEGFDACAEASNGFCCNPDQDPQGDWCMTEATCGGRDRDYCSPKPPWGIQDTLISAWGHVQRFTGDAVAWISRR